MTQEAADQLMFSPLTEALNPGRLKYVKLPFNTEPMNKCLLILPQWDGDAMIYKKGMRFRWENGKFLPAKGEIFEEIPLYSCCFSSEVLCIQIDRLTSKTVFPKMFRYTHPTNLL